MRIEEDVQVVHGTAERVKKQLSQLRKKRNKVIAAARRKTDLRNS